MNQKLCRKKKRKRCEFLDDEAEISGDDSSDIEKTYDPSSILEFVTDSSNSEAETTHAYFNQRAIYLKSIRSPNKMHGFKIPKYCDYMNASSIYSQPVIEETVSAYKEDSFVVTDEEEANEKISQICPLEIAEIALEAKRKERRKNIHTNGKNKTNTRKRIQTLPSSDETSDDS